MLLQILMSAALCSCTVTAMPQTYGAVGVLHPQSNTDLGPYENTVAAVIDILPEITDIFQQLADDRGRTANPKPDFVLRAVMAFLPMTRKIMEASAKAEGRAVTPEELQRLNVAEKILPPVFTFMGELLETVGTGSDLPRSSDAPAEVSGLEGPSYASPSNVASNTRLPVLKNVPSSSYVTLPGGVSYVVQHTTGNY
ncbi:uncharacterized protein [Panulirus ornatus]|uniref:uncharacterized protein n=1 Tax=Panulirus ornatus TaxID=150431 RepID=UPI003A835587